MKQVFLPMMHMRVPSITDFSSENCEDEYSAVLSLIELFPSEDRDRDGFIRRVTNLYDHHTDRESGPAKKARLHP